jgi:hypothetical protein
MGTRHIHGEVAGIADCALVQLPLIERAGSLQHNGGDQPFALAHMGLKPGRNARLSRRRRQARACERDQDAKADAVGKAQPSGNDPVSSMRTVRAECRRAAGTLCSICGLRDVLCLDRTDDHDFNRSRACRDKQAAPRSSWPGFVPAIHAVSGLKASSVRRRGDLRRRSARPRRRGRPPPRDGLSRGVVVPHKLGPGHVDCCVDGPPARLPQTGGRRALIERCRASGRGDDDLSRRPIGTEPSAEALSAL